MSSPSVKSLLPGKIGIFCTIWVRGIYWDFWIRKEQIPSSQSNIPNLQMRKYPWSIEHRWLDQSNITITDGGRSRIRSPVQSWPYTLLHLLLFAKASPVLIRFCLNLGLK
jgi:hypothetical protein